MALEPVYPNAGNTNPAMRRGVASRFALGSPGGYQTTARTTNSMGLIDPRAAIPRDRLAGARQLARRTGSPQRSARTNRQAFGSRGLASKPMVITGTAGRLER